MLYIYNIRYLKLSYEYLLMIEVEVRARLENPERVIEKLKGMGAEFRGVLEQNDRIFALENPGEPIKEGGIVARIREENGSVSLEFKEVVRESGGFDISSPIKDAGIAERLLEKLGLNFMGIIRKSRKLFILEGFEVALDSIEGLGDFIEVEKAVDSEVLGGEAREGCMRLLQRIAGDVKIENRKYGDLLLEREKQIKREG